VCRNIRVLHNFSPPATDAEVHDAALQYVRKISGAARPSAANAEAFDRAVAAVTAATRELLDSLVTTAPPKDRETEAAKARERAAVRYGRA
jgi:hypothetical protein